MAEAVEDAFRYDKMVLAAATYDGGIFPCMEDFLHHLKSKNFQKRTVALMENGSWAPMAAKNMKALLEQMKEITVCEKVVSIKCRKGGGCGGYGSPCRRTAGKIRKLRTGMGNGFRWRGTVG